MLGHIDDLDDVCSGVAALLAPGGAIVMEVPYLADLVDRAEYDTIYHEHLSYFAVQPLAALFGRHGLRLERVKFFPVHGGTIRVTAMQGEACHPWCRNGSIAKQGGPGDARRHLTHSPAR